jgi:hypothetical protein
MMRRPSLFSCVAGQIPQRSGVWASMKSTAIGTILRSLLAQFPYSHRYSSGYVAQQFQIIMLKARFWRVLKRASSKTFETEFAQTNSY